MKIAIMGTGGMGGYIGGRLAHAGNDVTFIARGRQLEALLQSGLEVRSVTESFHIDRVNATNNPAEVGPVDLIVLSVKAFDVAAVTETMRPLVGTATTIVPVLNGVDHISTLSEILGAGHVLGGLASFTAHVVAPGNVERIGEHGSFEFGEQSGGITPRVEAVEPVLGIEGLNATASPDIMAGMWQKLGTICGANICCVVRGDMGTVRRGRPQTLDLMRQLIMEVVEVSRAMSVDLTDAAIDSCMDLLGSVPEHFKPSMLVSLEHGSRTELEALNGAVVRYGRASGVATPANEFVYACLKPYMDGVKE